MKINEHDWKTRIGIVFQAAIGGQLAEDVLNSLLEAHVYKDLDGNYENGLPVYSDSTKVYVCGLVEQEFKRLFADHLEYCFQLDGVLYSTHRCSIHLQALNIPAVFDYRIGAHYWRGSNTLFTPNYVNTMPDKLTLG